LIVPGELESPNLQTKIMKKPWYSYCIVWIDKNQEQIFDVVDHYTSDEALEVIFSDEDYDKKISKILWMGQYPLSKSQMKERKAITGIEIS